MFTRSFFAIRVLCRKRLLYCKKIRGLKVLLEITMTISSNTPACERDFSCMNRGKSVLQTRLVEDTLDHIMRIQCPSPFLYGEPEKFSILTKRGGDLQFSNF